MSQDRMPARVRNALFSDTDLRTPAHDQIMLWLDGYIPTFLEEYWRPLWEASCRECEVSFPKHVETNIQQIQRSINDAQERQKRSSQARGSGWEPADTTEADLAPVREVLMRHESAVLTPADAMPAIPVVVKTWEYILKSRDFAMGAVDMVVAADMPSRVLYGATIEMAKDNWTVRTVPAVPRADVKMGRKVFAFEVKSTIPSMGELLRQIRLYEEYLKAIYVVVSPDDRFAQAIQDQGILFLKAPRAETGPQSNLF